MKKKLFLWMLCLPVVLMPVSCDKNNDDSGNEWRNTNEAAFNEVASGTQYQPVTTPQGPGTIYKKVIKSGTGTESPISTARVKVFYIGKFYDGTVFDPGSGEEVPAYFPAKTSTSYTNNGVISGFSIALQNMVIGDKWEIWIPWSLGYGSSSYGSIPGYSTLVFEVELLGFEQYPNEAK